MKFGKMLLIALLCGLFLLLLSALVVAPETETVLQENLPLTGLEMSACAAGVGGCGGQCVPLGLDAGGAVFLRAAVSAAPSHPEPGRQRLRAAPGPLSG